MSPNGRMKGVMGAYANTATCRERRWWSREEGEGAQRCGKGQPQDNRSPHFTGERAVGHPANHPPTTPLSHIDGHDDDAYVPAVPQVAGRNLHGLVNGNFGPWKMAVGTSRVSDAEGSRHRQACTSDPHDSSTDRWGDASPAPEHPNLRCKPSVSHERMRSHFKMNTNTVAAGQKRRKGTRANPRNITYRTKKLWWEQAEKHCVSTALIRNTPRGFLCVPWLQISTACELVCNGSPPGAALLLARATSCLRQTP